MLNWLVIGIGDITGKRVIPGILLEGRSHLYGILTRNSSKAAAYSGVRVFSDLDSALAQSDIDAVYVASPVFLHASQTIESLRAGKHVLCEKPMAMNYTEAGSMVGTATACDRILGVAYYRRLYPKIARARKLVEAGVIGKPVLAYISCHGWFDAGEGARSWLLDPLKAGGGPLFDIGSHRIDVLNFFFGEPVRVSAQLSNVIHRYPVEDSATVLIEYASGTRGIVDVRWNSRITRDEFRIIGSEGEIDMTPLNGPDLRWPGGEAALPAHANLHFPCIHNFVGHVLDGSPLLSSGATALWTDWVTSLASASRA